MKEKKNYPFLEFHQLMVNNGLKLEVVDKVRIKFRKIKLINYKDKQLIMKLTHLKKECINISHPIHYRLLILLKLPKHINNNNQRIRNSSKIVNSNQIIKLLLALANKRKIYKNNHKLFKVTIMGLNHS